ncbi:MAG: hypothetical protein HY667_05220 [Chloroflexi bacterium]|nr:hypothetical protein [Chloroflexota bacterium]
MKTVVSYLMVISLLAVGCAVRGPKGQAELGQEISLSLGQNIAIEGENLAIRFDEIIEDSRCPKKVVCIWEGRVSVLVRIAGGASPYEMVLTQPGLSDEQAKATYLAYQFAYRVRPYPEAGKRITRDQYRLLLTVNKR